MADKADVLPSLLDEIQACRVCAPFLPFAPRPVLQVAVGARLMIVGQAPGTKVHATGIPWNDPSGDRLRSWLGMDRKEFYDPTRIAIVPTGLCYPGQGKSGDLPPRPECAPLWHGRLRAQLPDIRLTLLIGKYAQNWYLGQRAGKNLTDTVRAFETYLPEFFPLPHPSPRNLMWLRRNPWFEQSIVPALRQAVSLALV